MYLHFLRHATFILELNGMRLLVDPMLSRAKEMDPVPNASSSERIPLVDLPIPEAELHVLLQNIDAVLVTHTHRDHWDAAAVALLSKELPIFCQSNDLASIREQGFVSVHPVDSMEQWHGLTLHRTGGKHGVGTIGERMGPVSGFVIQADQQPCVYVAGDTIWCSEVETALHKHQPAITVVNAGAAQFLAGDPITMTADDVIQVCRTLPGTAVIALHMEVINHCLLTRVGLASRLADEGVLEQVRIPGDGEKMHF